MYMYEDIIYKAVEDNQSLLPLPPFLVRLLS